MVPPSKPIGQMRTRSRMRALYFSITSASNATIAVLSRPVKRMSPARMGRTVTLPVHTSPTEET